MYYKYACGIVYQFSYMEWNDIFKIWNGMVTSSVGVVTLKKYLVTSYSLPSSIVT